MRESFARAWRGNVVHLAAAGLLMAVAAVELAISTGFGSMTWTARLLTTAYMLAAVSLPLAPVPASAAIVVAALAEALLPMFIIGDVHVHALWGLGYALIVLAVERSVWVSAIIALAFCVVSVVRDGELSTGAGGPGAFDLPARITVPFVLVALGAGMTVHLWRKVRADRAAAEMRRRLLEQENAQYAERLNMLHQLHDSVAGTLTYALMLCRRGRTEGDVAQYQYVESAIEEALDHMRREVIEPTRRLVDAHGTAPDGKPAVTASPMSPDAIDVQLGRIATRLRQLGYRCETLLRGDRTTLPEDRAIVIARTIEEIGNNILKHGEPGYCAITVTIDGDGAATIWSSNLAEPGRTRSADGTNGNGEGLDLIRRSIRPFGGRLVTSCEDDEWTTVVTIPAAGEDVAPGTGTAAVAESDHSDDRDAR